MLNDDSDEEIFSSKKKKNSDGAQTSSKNKNKSPKPALKEVKVVDMFGSAPIKRTEPLVKKKKKTELGIHSDDEFEKSLLEIDNAELEGKLNDEKVDNNEKTSTDKYKPSASKDKPENSTKETSHEKKHKINSNTESIKTDSNKSKKTDEHKPSKKIDESKESKKADEAKTEKQDNDKPSKTDKKHNQTSFNSNDGETKKSKTEQSKRKFSEFIDNDAGHDHGSKKKKFDEHGTTIKVQNDCDESVMEEEKETKKKRKMDKSLNESGKK